MADCCIQKQNGNVPATNQQTTRVVQKYTPAVDILERPDALVIVADVPGATADGIDIQFERGALTLHAAVQPRRENERQGCLIREYGVGHYERTFRVNEMIDADQITADLVNGVLTITLPKAEEARPRRIAVKAV